MQMADLLNLVVMIFTAVAAMLLGVLTSYAIFRAGFWLMHPDRKIGLIKPRAKTTVETA
jgi:membrane protein DedA with SNARE-associated domain